jgi:hypothetical protein
VDVFDMAADALVRRGEIANALTILKRKDDVVRAAHAAGFSKMELHKLTGLARTTIDRIVNQPA